MMPRHTQINRVLIAFITNIKVRLNTHKSSYSAVNFFKSAQNPGIIAKIVNKRNKNI
jgi:hypothetical protein